MGGHLMAQNDEASEKTYDPTPKKLEDARRKGDIVRSTDLNTAVVYGGILLATAVLGPVLGQTLGEVTQILMDQADRLADLILAPGGAAPAAGAVSPTFLAFLATIGIPALLLVATLIAQRAIIFTPSKLAPKISRVSLIQNAKQKFGGNGIFEFAKSSSKLLIYVILLIIFAVARLDEILGSIYASDSQVLAEMGRLSRDFLIFVFGISLAVGGIDFLWQSAEHIRKNRMSRKEITDEAKESDGDPHLKQQRRQRGYEIATNQMLSEVPDATVVIVNPTHYAVALRWERGQGKVPICIAKGVDEIAARIRETASENGVPIFRDAPTARQLFASVELGAPIERDQFRAVAAAIRFADLVRSKGRR